MEDRIVPTRTRPERGLSTPAAFLLAAVALVGVVAGLHFLPAQSGTPGYADGQPTTVEPTPQLEPVPEPPDPPLTNTSKLTAEEVRYVETWLFYYVNQERIRRGIDPLVRHDGLNLIARNRSYDMGVRDYFGHYDPDGELAYPKEFEKASYDACYKYGEDISASGYGMGAPSDQVPKTKKQIARAIARGLMYSAPHREAILDTEFDSLGVGLYAEDNEVFSTILFCDTGIVYGSRYYHKEVIPAVRYPGWLPEERSQIIQYDYDVDGTERVLKPEWLREVETLTPIPNKSTKTELAG